MGDDNSSTPLTAEQEKIDLEVTKEVEDSNLLDVDGKLYIDLICTGETITWRPVFFTNCGKLKINHPSPARMCARTTISQALKAKYERACKSNLVMEMAVENLPAKTKEVRDQARGPGGGGGAVDSRRYDNRT